MKLLAEYQSSITTKVDVIFYMCLFSFVVLTLVALGCLYAIAFGFPIVISGVLLVGAVFLGKQSIDMAKATWQLSHTVKKMNIYMKSIDLYLVPNKKISYLIDNVSNITVVDKGVLFEKITPSSSIVISILIDDTRYMMILLESEYKGFLQLMSTKITE